MYRLGGDLAEDRIIQLEVGKSYWYKDSPGNTVYKLTVKRKRAKEGDYFCKVVVVIPGLITELRGMKCNWYLYSLEGIVREWTKADEVLYGP